jgi:CSLREA domain-containing protein
MKRNGNTMMKVCVLLVMLAVMNSACSLTDIFARLCAGPFVVTKLTDTNDGLCTSTDCSLREAVVMSNGCPGTQTVRIPAGTYTLTRSGAGEEAGSTGDLDITDSAAILGEGNPVIDGNRQDRVFEVFGAATVDMTGITVQHGRGHGGGGIRNHGILRIHVSSIRENVAVAAGDDFGNGGGILSEGDGALTMNGSEVIGNSADQGGGIMVLANGVTSPPVELHEISVAENAARLDGGGLWLGNQVHATLTRFEIRDNSAAERNGNGIYNASTLTLMQGSIAGNRGGINGGGIYNEPAGDITAREVILQNNLTRFGGGIYNKGPARFYQSAIIDNEASRGEGGGIYNSDADAVLTVDNSTISGNTGLLGGGGIRNNGGNFQVIFSTIASNSVNGINGSGSGEMTVRNSIVSGHSGSNCAGTLPLSNGFNIDSANTCGFIGLSDLANTDPLLMPLGMYGGASPMHALDIGSPATDSADPDRCGGTDQRGVARPQGPRCDRGAYERDTTGGAGANNTPTETATPTPTMTGTATPPGMTLLKNANCRHGPGTVYPVLTSVLAGQDVQVIGRNLDNTWWYSIIPGGFRCWMSVSSGEPEGDPNLVPVVADPPTPTPTATTEPAQGSSDNDADGYPAGKDCNDKDAKVHPGAPESPNDNIDSNCNGDPNK